MNYESLAHLARAHQDEILRLACDGRRLRAGRPATPGGIRVAVARVVRAIGYATVSLGDALAPSR